MDMSKGNQPAYVVMIPQTVVKVVQKSWSKKIKQNTKAKVQQNGAEFSIMGTRIVEIYDEPMNVYGAVIQVDSSVKLIALFEIDSLFFSPKVKDSNINNEKIYQGIKQFMHNFAVEEYKYSVSVEMEMESNKLQTFANQLSKLEKQNTNYHKNITTNEQNIAKSESETVLLEKQQERNIEEVDKNRTSLSSAAGKKDEKDAKKRLNKSEKEKKTIENKLEKEKKKIIDYEAKVSELTRLADDNLMAQVSKREEIDVQKVVVEQVTQKLNNIK